MSVCCRDFTELSPDRDEGGWTGKGMKEEGGRFIYSRVDGPVGM